MNEPVVLIGGLGSGWHDYQSYGRALARVSGRRVFITGIRRISWVIAGLGDYYLLLHRAAAAVNHALEQTGASKVILVGHSAGGIIGRSYLADRLEKPSRAAYRGHERVSRFIALGSPLRVDGSPRHPGLRRAAWIDREFPGAYYAPGVQYLCVSGRYVEGKRRGTVEQQRAYRSYAFVSGRGGQWGDGVVPSAMSRLDGAPHLEIDGLGHSPGWGRWYLFDETTIAQWWHYFDQADAPARELGRMAV